MNEHLPIETTLRVKASKVSLLLDLVGELGLATLAVTHHSSLQGLELVGFETAVHQLELLINEVQRVTADLRLVPVSGLFRPMQRMAHDLARETGKPFEFNLEGEEIEIDKVLVDGLKDPLMHLVRNAVDHGLESATERIAAGKSEHGRITLTAAQKGKEIHISVTDDGRGLNRAAILRKARQAGLVGADEEPDDQTVWGFIFNAGFSTATQVSNLSGRGVGMDVVQNAVRSLHGRVMLDTRPGRGTSVTLVIPLTLAFLESMVVRSRERLFAIPIDGVHEVFKPETTEILHSSADQSEMVRRQDSLVMINRLEHIFGNGQSESSPLSEQVIVVVETSKGKLGLPVDEIVGEQQVVIKPLQGHLRGIRGGAGCALLNSGQVAIALDVENLGQNFKSRAEVNSNVL
ncbi:MAG: chemotaxis protein CheW [Chloroflexi bacterium]|nr:chemotaxis protein CheW [Chloroflexota bacterium]